jgi:hypothetical protein
VLNAKRIFRRARNIADDSFVIFLSPGNTIEEV